MKRFLTSMMRSAPSDGGKPAAPRATPFTPKGDRPPLFFLHIPKTSGSSINAFLSSLYGAQNFIRHAEYRLPKLVSGGEPTLAVDAVSAHVPLCRWRLLPGTDAYARVTILRDPWARLVSHINWVDRFNHGEPLPGGVTAPAVARVVATMAETDFEDESSLLHLMQVVAEEPHFTAFDNMQVRMLLTVGGPRATFRTLQPTDAQEALQELAQFAVVGICEDQSRFQSALMDMLDIQAVVTPLHENPGQKLAIQRDNAVARAVLAPWYALDQELYDGVRAARGL